MAAIAFQEDKLDSWTAGQPDNLLYAGDNENATPDDCKGMLFHKARGAACCCCCYCCCHGVACVICRLSKYAKRK